MPRKYLSYANVAAALAVILAMSGVVYAASVPRSSVGTRQLKNRAVTTPKLAAGAVGTKKVADRSLTLADLGGIRPGDFEQPTGNPIALDPGQCKAQVVIHIGTDPFGNDRVGNLVVGNLTDPNGDAVFPNRYQVAFMPSIVTKTTSGPAVNLVVCNTGSATETIPQGSVFHYRFIEP